MSMRFLMILIRGIRVFENFLNIKFNIYVCIVVIIFFEFFRLIFYFKFKNYKFLIAFGGLS